ncbi:hypothetical protein [Aureimonas altamirensis]|uniref:hypothetical protein n=1 Tax=Aureimonas altamirensis TaxID=370622 RepID=UPI003019DE30
MTPTEIDIAIDTTPTEDQRKELIQTLAGIVKDRPNLFHVLRVYRNSTTDRTYFGQLSMDRDHLKAAYGAIAKAAGQGRAFTILINSMDDDDKTIQTYIYITIKEYENAI